MLVFGVISEASPLYLSLNLVGAFAVMYLSYKKKNFQPMVLNIVWSAVALIGLVRVFFFI